MAKIILQDRGFMRQISLINKKWIGKYIKRVSEVNLHHLIVKKALEEKDLVLKKRKHKKMMKD
jgi:hypothetical protein